MTTGANSVTLNGKPYTDEMMKAGGFQNEIFNMGVDMKAEVAGAATSASDASGYATAAASSATAAQNYAAALQGTSTTSLSIGTGTKVFTTQSGKQWALGQRLRAASDDGAKLMDGEVTAYSSTTLTISADYTEGSGTHADWNISIVGARGAQGTTGSNGAGVPAIVGGDGAKLLRVRPDESNYETILPWFNNVTIMTSGGTFTPETGRTKYLVILVAGGGSGGKSSGSAYNWAGQAGQVVFGIMTISSAQTVTIGAGGAAKTTTGNGNDGSDSSIGSLAVAKGGKGGDSTTTMQTLVTSLGTVPSGCIGMLGNMVRSGLDTGVSLGSPGFLQGALAAVGANQPAGGWGAGGAPGNTSYNSGAGGDGLAIFIW